MERCVDIEALAAKIEKEINDLERKVDRVDSNEYRTKDTMDFVTNDKN